MSQGREEADQGNINPPAVIEELSHEITHLQALLREKAPTTSIGIYTNLFTHMPKVQHAKLDKAGSSVCIKVS